MAGNGLEMLEPQDEPSLDELFAEPIVQLIMKRDGVNMHDILGHWRHVVGLLEPRTT